MKKGPKKNKHSEVCVCVSYPGNVEVFLRLDVCSCQRHTHHQDDHAGPHGGEECQEAGRSEAVPAGWRVEGGGGASDPGPTGADGGTERAKPNLGQCLPLS